MNINRSTVLHYFCIAPKSIVQKFRASGQGPLWVFLGEGIGKEQWMNLMGIIPPFDKVLIAEYEDGKRVVDLGATLPTIGIICDPKIQVDAPSAYCRSFGITDHESGSGQHQIVLGFTFRIAGSHLIVNGDKPATFS